MISIKDSHKTANERQKDAIQTDYQQNVCSDFSSKEPAKTPNPSYLYNSNGRLD